MNKTPLENLLQSMRQAWLSNEPMEIWATDIDAVEAAVLAQSKQPVTDDVDREEIARILGSKLRKKQKV